METSITNQEDILSLSVRRGFAKRLETIETTDLTKQAARYAPTPFNFVKAPGKTVEDIPTHTFQKLKNRPLSPYKFISNIFK